MIWPEEADLEERFRRRCLLLLERAGRLRPETRERFLARRHSGFSVRTTQCLPAGERASLQRLARYATRVVLAVGAVEWLDGGRVRVETAPDPRTGSTVLEMDRLDLVELLPAQASLEDAVESAAPGSAQALRRQAWARLLPERSSRWIP